MALSKSSKKSFFRTAKSYLKDMSQQVINLFPLGPTIVAQKSGGREEGCGGGGGGGSWGGWRLQEFRPLMLTKTGGLQSPSYI